MYVCVCVYEAVTDGDSDPPHLHVVEDFEEGEGHPTADDHLIHLIQHVIDQLDLIFHLCSEKKTNQKHQSW